MSVSCSYRQKITDLGAFILDQRPLSSLTRVIKVRSNNYSCPNYQWIIKKLNYTLTIPAVLCLTNTSQRKEPINKHSDQACWENRRPRGARRPAMCRRVCALEDLSHGLYLIKLRALLAAQRDGALNRWQQGSNVPLKVTSGPRQAVAARHAPSLNGSECQQSSERSSACQSFSITQTTTTFHYHLFKVRKRRRLMCLDRVCYMKWSIIAFACTIKQNVKPLCYYVGFKAKGHSKS